jgi:hypothetical protein
MPLVVIDIAGLEPAGSSPDGVGDGRDAVGAQAVDDLLVALLPEQVAKLLCAANENKIIDFVEEPLVVEEGPDQAAPGRDARRHAFVEDIGVPGAEKSERGHRQGGPDDPRRQAVQPRQQTRSQAEDRGSPERDALFADEEGRERPPGRQGAQRQQA